MSRYVRILLVGLLAMLVAACEADRPMNTQSPSATILGVYPYPFTRERLLHVAEACQWKESYEAGREYEEKLEHEALQMRQNMEGLHLIEMEIEGFDESFDWCEVGQPEPGAAAENRQVPYDELYLTQDGQEALKLMSRIPSAKTIRVVFFLHFLDQQAPIRGPWGLVVLPAPSPLPARLDRLVTYLPP